jgi:acetyl esterase/lipase
MQRAAAAGVISLMRITSLLLLSLCLLSPLARAADEPPTMNVWPAKPPGDTGTIGAEQWGQNGKPSKRVTNVTIPTLTVFRPEKDKDTGVAVIVCPGGGYKALMMDYEGEDVAKWLNSLGVTGIVLKYRVPAPEGVPAHLPALQDAQRAMSIVRSKAKEWNLDEKRIGMLGFSAGAHLTAAASTNFDQRAYDPIDETDKISCRPDFGIVIYPGGMFDKASGQLKPEIRVSAQTPPTFIVQANDDKVNPENSVLYYLALKRAGVAAEVHIYAAGGHGFGMKPSDKPVATWPMRLEEWMRNQGVLKGATASATKAT